MKHGAFTGEAVDVGRFGEWVAGAAELVEAEVVHEDEDDVGSLLSMARSKKAEGKQRGEDERGVLSHESVIKGEGTLISTNLR
jgi:hypothetical protein